MRDTLSFAKLLTENIEFDKAFSSFFDQHMALYNLVGSCDSIERIHGEVKNSNISFLLTFKSNTDALIMNQTLENSSPAIIYGRIFIMNMKQMDNTLIVEFE